MAGLPPGQRLNSSQLAQLQLLQAHRTASEMQRQAGLRAAAATNGTANPTPAGAASAGGRTPSPLPPASTGEKGPGQGAQINARGGMTAVPALQNVPSSAQSPQAIAAALVNSVPLELLSHITTNLRE